MKPPRLVNVRLDAERLRKVRLLRERGVALSALVREAIDAQYATLTRDAAPRDVKQLVAQLFDRHPDAPDDRPRDYDVHTAREARQAVRRRLARPRR